MKGLRRTIPQQNIFQGHAKLENLFASVLSFVLSADRVKVF